LHDRACRNYTIVVIVIYRIFCWIDLSFYHVISYRE